MAVKTYNKNKPKGKRLKTIIPTSIKDLKLNEKGLLKKLLIRKKKLKNASK